MATIKDIAREADVSTMMVSRVINKHYNQVSAENIARIEEIIKKYDYVPNSAARSLSSKSSRIIAIFVQGDSSQLYRPYNAVMLGCLMQNIQNQGYDAMIHFISDYSEVFDKLRSWKASGAIFLGMFQKDLMKIQVKADVPFVFTDCYSDSQQFANVGIDDYKGGVLAAQHLLECGHRDFALVGEYINDSPLGQRRLKGFRDTLEASGINFGPENVIDLCAPDPVGRLLRLRKDHLAVFVLSDLVAAHLIKQLAERGYSVPNDLSFVGFDDLYVSRLVNPGLTTISQDLEKKATTAVDLLFQYLKYPDFPLQNISLDVSLVNRATVKMLKQG
ncbi:MAG: LacI family DNA-binding transcriptional regulator [Faecousia sp.]